MQTEPKKMICVDVVGQMQSAWFIRANERATSWFEQNLKFNLLFWVGSLQ